MDRKRFLLVIFVLAAAAVTCFSEVVFSGTAGFRMDGFFSDDFSSPVNPSNILGMDDVLISHEGVFKLDGYGDQGNDGFSLWMSLSAYPLGQDSGDTIIGIDLERINYTWNPGSLSITLGRQSFLSGYGYGWNPMDLVSALKDPMDPLADTKGMDGISVSLDSGLPVAARFYGLFNTEGSSYGASSFEDIKGGGEISLYLPGFEIKAAGTAGKPGDGQETVPSGAGLGFMADIAGAGFYAEGAVRRYGRVPEIGYDGSEYSLVSGDEWRFSGLTGLEYFFASGTGVILEYFYNGEGFDQPQRELYLDALLSAEETFLSSLLELYRPGFFARHYVLLNILHSFWDPFQTDISLTGIYSPDSGAVTAAGLITIYPSGSLSFELGYTGLFSIYGDASCEADLAPVSHVISLSADYSW